MGMAASQARFLGLTARKTNVEYEGQQINQQRTALGNQTANYYNQMLGMKVPVPPAIDDFTKTVYAFEDGALKNTITSLIAQSNGEYKVSYLRQWVDDFAVVSAAPSIVTYVGSDARPHNGDTSVTPPIPPTQAGEFMIGGQRLALLGGLHEDDAGTAIADLDETAPSLQDNFRPDDAYWASLSVDQRRQLLQQEAMQVGQLRDAYGTPTTEFAVRYILNTTTGAYQPQFFNLDVLRSPNSVYDIRPDGSGSGNSQTAIPAYTVGSATKNEEVKGITARLEQDASGRIVNITLNAGADDTHPVTYALVTNTVADQARYNDAMNQYEYDKYQYDQQIGEINAKIQIIQAQDKNLELRLKQLDTEQNAIQTEMDAVSKVIQKNVESTFKTFG